MKRHGLCVWMCVLVALLGLSAVVRGQAVIDLTHAPAVPVEGTLKVGGKNPAGVVINVNTQYLTLDGKPWTPVMGEFHYMRYPRADWDEEMRKMKAGGITVLSTYVIWIYHEETQGQFDWMGNKDLGAFIAACKKNDLKVALRIGPWVHSEARNGGIPDWVVEKCGRSVRSTDAQFMAFTKTFYEETFQQVKGMMWKDGGLIVDIQVDNESTNIAYLQALKTMAQGIGFDAPIWSITAWDHVRPPESGLVPMFGGYADGFWYNDKGIPEKGRTHYFFTPVRDDSEIQTADLQPTRNSADLGYINKYPFLTCEIGGGMAIAYARRPLMSWQDVTASALTQFGAGSNLLGYYMYHGGAHPLGKNGQGLQEKQDSPTTNYNDIPPIHYDFQAAIGQYGQVRPVYHSLNLLHMFIHDFGGELAKMPAYWPAEMPDGVPDVTTLRWTVRSDGKSGFVFIKNYERGRDMPARDVKLDLETSGGELTIPAGGAGQTIATLPANTFAIWPFNLDLNGVNLKYATAQLIGKLDNGADGKPVYLFFAPGDMKTEFAFNSGNTQIGMVRSNDGVRAAGMTGNAVQSAPPGATYVNPTAGTGRPITVTARGGGGGTILVLTQAQAMHLYKAHLWGADRVLMSNADLAFDGDNVMVTGRDAGDLSIEVYPAPAKGLMAEGKLLETSMDGVFTKYAASVPAKTVMLELKKVKDAGPARALVMGPSRRPAVPTEPVDADFDAAGGAGVWQVSVPADALAEGAGVHEVFVRVDYAGDCGRAYVGEQFVDDDFYFGQPWEIGVKRFMPAISEKGLTLKMLPMRKDSPVYVEPEKRLAFGDKTELLDVRSITAEVEYQLTIQAAP